MDFDRDNSTYTNSSGTWNYFFASQHGLGVLYSIYGGYPDAGHGYNSYATSWQNIGELWGDGGTNVWGGSFDMPNWAVDQWVVGQSLRFQDKANPSEGRGAIYLSGSVTLESFTTIPEPSSCAILTFSFAIIFSLSSRRNTFRRRGQHGVSPNV